MFKIIKNNLILVAIMIFFVSIPAKVFGAQLSFELLPNRAGDEQATIVEIKIDPEDKTLNVVEGVIVFEGVINDKLSVETETGGSVFTIWPTQPRYLPQEKAIRFTGGVPGGFNQKGSIFRMRLSSLSSGDIKINWVNGMAYLNDGKGTKEAIFAKSLIVNLIGNDLKTAKRPSFDKKSPSFENVEIGRDNSVYDGKHFISFNAVDDSSGVDRYEVKEGQDVTIVTEGVYVFKDQTKKTPISITVYDKAGNNAVINVSSGIDWQKYVIITLSILLFIFYAYKKK